MNDFQLAWMPSAKIRQQSSRRTRNGLSQSHFRLFHHYMRGLVQAKRADTQGETRRAEVYNVFLLRLNRESLSVLLR